MSLPIETVAVAVALSVLLSTMTTRHHSGQNVVVSQGAASESTTNLDHCDDVYRCRQEYRQR